jgi:hypothetical protein
MSGIKGKLSHFDMSEFKHMSKYNIGSIDKCLKTQVLLRKTIDNI